MASRAGRAEGRPPLPPSRSGASSGPTSRDIKKVIGIALMGVGAIFALYGAGSGLSTLVSVTLNNFGLVCIAGIANFIFWSIFFTPLGGLLANTVCGACAVLLFGGLPAIPGGLVAAGGAFVYINV